MRAQAFEADSSFHAWAAEHPDGLVINVRRRLSPDYVILHRVTCPSLSEQSYVPGALTERSYRKIGASSEEELLDWIEGRIPNARGFSKRCSRCGS